MSTDQSGEHRVPDQSTYEQQTADTNWVDLEDGDGSFEIQEVAPLKLLRDMRKYGVAGLLGGDKNDVDMAAMLEDGDFDAFLEKTVLPNIIQPKCYWSDVGSGNFDLAALTPNDLMIVITGMTGQDRDELDEKMDETFQG